jgi:hypothetical protein
MSFFLKIPQKTLEGATPMTIRSFTPEAIPYLPRRFPPMDYAGGPFTSVSIRINWIIEFSGFLIS